MDPVTQKLLLYMVKVMDGALGTVLASPAAKKSVSKEMEALRSMVDEGRAPSANEWAEHDASMAVLKSALHTD